MIFAAGQLASDFKTGVPAEARRQPSFPFYGSEVKLQTRFVLENLKKTFAAAGSSLDHVFKTATPAQGTQAANFSFDQFFSDDMSEQLPSAGGEATGARSEATDDIAQFNAWLSGLKKT